MEKAVSTIRDLLNVLVLLVHQVSYQYNFTQAQFKRIFFSTLISVGKFDLALLLDTRHSIGDEALQKTRDFARSLLEPYDMGPDSIKVTAAGYSGEKVTPASFLIDAAAKPKQALIDSVTKVNFSGNGLRIERSLAFLVNFSFLEAMGRRKANPGIAILTAGM